MENSNYVGHPSQNHNSFAYINFLPDFRLKRNSTLLSKSQHIDMNNHSNTLNIRLFITFFITFLCCSLGVSGSSLINNQASKPVSHSNDVRTPFRNQEIPIPADGDCLYKSIMSAYLLPVVNQFSEFKERLNKLIGKACSILTEENNDDEKDDYKDDCKYDDEKDDYKDDCKDDNEINVNDKWDTKKLQKIFLNLQRLTLVDSLRAQPFPKLVKAMKKHIGIYHNLWGGPQEIKKIANHLRVTIQEYTPDFKDKHKLVLLNTTKPEYKKSLLTLRIVKDNPTQKETVNPGEDSSMQQARILSVESAQHRQHYRILLNEEVIKHLETHPDQSRINFNHLTNNKAVQNQFKSDLATIQVPRNLMELRWSTSPYECAILSKHIYNSDIQEVEQVSIQLDNEKEARHFPDWKVYKTYLPQNEGYKAVIYHNAKKRQIVLAYRGTYLENRRDLCNDLATDIMGIALNKRGYQEKYIPFMLDALQEAIFSQKEGKIYGCTITGHSLGGWLAQLTPLIAYHYAQKSPEKFYMKNPIKVITFESPGAKEAMLSMIQEESSEKKILDLFDITNYYSSPNFINCTGSSFGTRYRTVFAYLSNLPVNYTRESHQIKRLIQSFNEEHGYSTTCRCIKKWPMIFSEQEYRKLHNFISQNSLYHIDYNHLASQDLFKVLYREKLQYETTTYDSSYIHARHIPPNLRAWLLAQKNKNTDLWPSLAYYLTPSEEKQGFWYTETTFDTQCIVDFLCSFQLNPNPSLLRFYTESKNLAKRIKESKVLLNNLPNIDEFIDANSRSQELLRVAQYLKERKVCIIHGYPGLGKSTLARLYGHQHLKKRTYQHIWWIDFTTLNDSLQEVVNMLKEGKNSHHMPTEEQHKKYIKQILQHLSGWLLIIDNAPSIKAIQNLLPSRGGDVLITSRDGSTTWNHLGKRYELGSLSEKNAYQLLEKLAPPQSEEEKKQAYALAKALYYIPLALHNAGYNIRNQVNNSSYANYLKNFRKQLSQLNILHIHHSQSKEEQHTKMIQATYLQSIEKIALYEKDSVKETLHILTIIAYLDPYGLAPDFVAHCSLWQKCFFISNRLSSKIIGRDTGRKGIGTLVKYGLLSSLEYRIHEICQDTIRFWSKKILETSQSEIPRHYQLMHLLFPYGHQSIYKAGVKLLVNLQKSINPHNPLRLVGIDHARKLIEHVQNSKLKENISLRLCCQLLGTINYLKAHAYPLDLYIPPECQEGDMHKKVLAFIYKNYSFFESNITSISLNNVPRVTMNIFGFTTYKPLLLIKGGAGTGKSMYVAWLTRELIKAYNDAFEIAEAPIPLFIFLPAYVQGNGKLPTDLINQVFKGYGITSNTIRKLKQLAKKGKQPFIFIMDSYDEALLRQNITRDCNLDAWGAQYSRYIITCRTNYLEKEPQASYYREGNLFRWGNSRAEEIDIASFNENRINDYIKKFVDLPYNKDGKGNKIATLEQYKNKIHYPKIKRMATTPFMLCMLLLSIPKIDSTNEKVSLYQIYNALTDVWLDREIQKTNTQVARATIITFCEKLAFEMWKNNVNTLSQDNKQVYHFFRKAQFIHAPLRQIEKGQYVFLQPTYRDFFAAQYICKNPIEKKTVSQEILNDDFVIFLTKGLYENQKNQLIQQCWKEVNKAFQETDRGVEAAYHLQLFYYINKKNLKNKNLSGINLQHGNLSGLDLRTTQFDKANLSHVNLKYAKLPKNLSHWNLRGADLSYQNLRESILPKDLSGCDLRGAQLPKDLSQCDLRYSKLPKDLSGCNLKGADLSGQDLTTIKLPQDLSRCNLKAAQLPKDLSACNLTGANLSGQDLRGIKLPKDLSGCDLRGAQLPKDLSQCDLRYSKLPKDLSGCNLKGADLSGQDLTTIKLPQDLSRCNLKAAQLPQDLSRCNLKGANLFGQDLTTIKLPQDLSRCNLKEAQLPKDLSKCKLTGANLSGQNLTTIKLPKDLSGCNLRRAKLPEDLSKCKLTGANLSGQNLTTIKLPKDLSGCNLRRAKLPEDLSKYNFTNAILYYLTI